MERDFMGLNSKDSVVIKEEEDEEEEEVEGGCKDSGLARSSGVAWPQSNKISALPHFMSLKTEQDEKPSTNFGGASMKQQFLGGNLPSIPPSTASIAGMTEQGINSKVSGVPAQLTIFYAGTVNVFDGISPEKAQAIMLLAGNGFITSNMVQSKPHVQSSASNPPAANGPINTPPCSGLPSPMSVSSYPIDQSANNDDVKVSKTFAMSATTVNKVEPQRMVSSLGAATAMISAAVPQARKASLARFLEKRKERAMNAAPYKSGKTGADCAEANGFEFSATSGVGSSPVSASGEA